LVIDPTLAYSTYLGGSGDDYAFAVATREDGAAYVAGKTSSIVSPAGAASGVARARSVKAARIWENLEGCS
jgi:hypothetical protein